jgi:hypothetical protein
MSEVDTVCGETQTRLLREMSDDVKGWKGDFVGHV